MPEIKDDVLKRYEAFSDAFRRSIADADYKSASNIADAYMDYAKDMEEKSKALRGQGVPLPFGDKSKFYSSILEEIPVLMMERETERLIKGTAIEGHDFVLGGQNCIIRQCVTQNASFWSETKNIDFVFAAKIKGTLNTFIPLYGLEVKKYMDKTMFTTVMDTVRSLSYLRPRTNYGILIEEEARSPDVVLNSPLHRAEFVLSSANRTRTGRREIQPSVMQNLHMTLQMWAAQAVQEMGG